MSGLGVFVRGAVIDGSIVIRLVTSHCLRRGLLLDQGALSMRGSRRLRRVDLDRRLLGL
jgi:hypothetical protein